MAGTTFIWHNANNHQTSYPNVSVYSSKTKEMLFILKSTVEYVSYVY